jgi:hypothetical protein
MCISPTRAPWHFLVTLMLTPTKSFSLSHLHEEKRQFLDLIRASEDIGNDYIENDFMLPTNEEIRNARPLQTILPEDGLKSCRAHRNKFCVGAEDDRAAQKMRPHQPHPTKRLPFSPSKPFCVNVKPSSSPPNSISLARPSAHLLLECLP